MLFVQNSTILQDQTSNLNGSRIENFQKRLSIVNFQIFV